LQQFYSAFEIWCPLHRAVTPIHSRTLLHRDSASNAVFVTSQLHIPKQEQCRKSFKQSRHWRAAATSSGRRIHNVIIPTHTNY
jgi:hypothetical protein